MHIYLSRLTRGSLGHFNAVGSVITLSDCLSVPEGFIFGHKYISIYICTVILYISIGDNYIYMPFSIDQWLPGKSLYMGVYVYTTLSLKCTRGL